MKTKIAVVAGAFILAVASTVCAKSKFLDYATFIFPEEWDIVRLDRDAMSYHIYALDKRNGEHHFLLYHNKPGEQKPDLHIRIVKKPLAEVFE